MVSSMCIDLGEDFVLHAVVSATAWASWLSFASDVLI